MAGDRDLAGQVDARIVVAILLHGIRRALAFDVALLDLEVHRGGDGQIHVRARRGVGHHPLRQHPALPDDQRGRGRQGILAVVRQPDLVLDLRRIKQPGQLALLFVVQVGPDFRRWAEGEFEREDVFVRQRELGNRQHHPLAPLEGHVLHVEYEQILALAGLADFRPEFGGQARPGRRAVIAHARNLLRHDGVAEIGSERTVAPVRVGLEILR